MRGIIGIDTHFLKKEWVTKDGDKKSFKSLVGVGVAVRDYDVFMKAYSKAMKQTLKVLNIKTDKEILCNFDFLKIYSKTKKPIHQIFFKEIVPHIESVNIFYTLTNPSVEMRWMGHVEKELKHE